MSRHVQKIATHTGWFGIPGANGRWSTKVHLVDAAQKPVCGARLNSKQQFQWCSVGIHESYVECEKCKVFAVKARSK